MDFKAFLEMVKPMACIISVETYPDGSYGNIRIVDGNDLYLNSTTQWANMDVSGVATVEFIPNTPYERYMERDLNFEDFCYRAAVLGKTMNTYVKPERFPLWIHLTMLPMPSDQPNIHYCLYTQEFSEDADPSMIELAPDIAASVLKTCVKLHRTDDFRQSMNDIIADIREMCGAMHCCILLTDQSERQCSLLCEAFSKDSVKPIIPVRFDSEDFYALTESWMDTVAGSTCLIVKDQKDWDALRQRNAEWYASLQASEVKSIVLFPLKNRGELLGYIWAGNFNTENAEKIKETLEITTYFIASQIANHQMVKRLKTLSVMDLLTGVLNRNAMNNRVDELSSGGEGNAETVGVVFADLNGLKAVNDCDGHFAGDLLLKNAALVLQRCFPEYEIYRSGGDEFAVIALNVAETELHRRIVQLRGAAAAAEGVSFAVGCCSKPAREIRGALRTADERMYEDKLTYYQLHPGLRRK